MLATSRMKTAPSKPLGSFSTHIMNYAQNDYLVLQGPVYHRLGIFLLLICLKQSTPGSTVPSAMFHFLILKQPLTR